MTNRDAGAGDSSTPAPAPPVKPGYLTTEFWSTLGGFVVLVLPAFHVVAAPELVRAVSVAAGGFVIAGYGFYRSLVKVAHTQTNGAVRAKSG